MQVIDRIIGETLKIEAEEGIYHFLMPYARNRAFVVQPPRSLFLDGEIALMMAARRTVAEKEEYRERLRRRVDEMVRRMEAGPVMCAKSYPDECWMFCNAVALAAVRMSDRLDGTDHADFFRRWLATARSKLVDPGPGLLVSSSCRISFLTQLRYRRIVSNRRNAAYGWAMPAPGNRGFAAEACPMGGSGVAPCAGRS